MSARAFTQRSEIVKFREAVDNGNWEGIRQFPMQLRGAFQSRSMLACYQAVQCGIIAFSPCPLDGLTKTLANLPLQLPQSGRDRSKGAQWTHLFIRDFAQPRSTKVDESVSDCFNLVGG